MSKISVTALKAANVLDHPISPEEGVQGVHCGHKGIVLVLASGVRPSSRTGGEPTIDQGAGPCRSKAMARHRIHSLAFKKQVVQEYAAGATLNALAREHDLSRTLIRIWIAKCESGEFDPDVEAATLLGDYEAKIATLERMIGRQAVEIEFLKGALQQGRSPRSAPMSVIAGPAVSPSLKDAG